jgi:hypothetical protein
MISRRQLFKLFGGAAVTAIAMSAGLGSTGCESATSAPVGDTIFTGDELAMLRGFCDVVIPPDDTPGGADLGAIEFIEALITAFDPTAAPSGAAAVGVQAPDDGTKRVPLIFAGGPVSDRNPNLDGSLPANDFTAFIELDRVKATAWQLIVNGSAGVPGGAPNDALLGPVIGIKDQLKTGLQAAIASTKKSIADLEADDFKGLFNASPSAFQSFLIDLVIEGSFSAPEYGGNLDLAGWKMIHFEGDSLPRGYSQFDGTHYIERPEAPLSTANPSDPEPLTDDVRSTLVTVVTVLGGRAS